jgi:hypothetical protein
MKPHVALKPAVLALVAMSLASACGNAEDRVESPKTVVAALSLEYADEARGVRGTFEQHGATLTAEVTAVAEGSYHATLSVGSRVLGAWDVDFEHSSVSGVVDGQTFSASSEIDAQTKAWFSRVEQTETGRDLAALATSARASRSSITSPMLKQYFTALTAMGAALTSATAADDDVGQTEQPLCSPCISRHRYCSATCTIFHLPCYHTYSCI